VSITRESTAAGVDIGGTRLSYNEAGSGPVVLAIHGGGPGASGWANYARNIEALAQHSRVILLDLPGFGRSDNPGLEWPVLDFYSGWVRRFLDALDIGEATLLGNSLGGAISLRTAIDAPERVSSLVLMGPAGSYQLFTRNNPNLYLSYYDDPTRERLLPWVRNMVYDQASLTEELIAERHEVSIRPEIVADPPMQPWVEIAGRELAGQLDRVQAPTLLVWGRDDRAIGVDAGIYLVNTLPEADLHVLSHCGHWAQWERADDFNALVARFLEKQRARVAG
jgi:pimeloyl-ACP methyl ester carboxylesterase